MVRIKFIDGGKCEGVGVVFDKYDVQNIEGVTVVGVVGWGIWGYNEDILVRVEKSF